MPSSGANHQPAAGLAPSVGGVFPPGASPFLPPVLPPGAPMVPPALLAREFNVQVHYSK